MGVNGLPLIPLGTAAARAIGGVVSDVGQLVADRLDNSSEPSGRQNSASPSLREVLARYELKRISPQDISKLARDLNEAGLINGEEFERLAGVRVELENAGIAANERIDVIAFLEERLNQILEARAADEETDSADDSVQRLTRQLDWLRQLAAGGRTSESLDTVV